MIVHQCKVRAGQQNLISLPIAHFNELLFSISYSDPIIKVIHFPWNEIESYSAPLKMPHKYLHTRYEARSAPDRASLLKSFRSVHCGIIGRRSGSIPTLIAAD